MIEHRKYEQIEVLPTSDFLSEKASETSNCRQAFLYVVCSTM
jgi:hypothetical protein